MVLLYFRSIWQFFTLLGSIPIIFEFIFVGLFGLFGSLRKFWFFFVKNWPFLSKSEFLDYFRVYFLYIFNINFQLTKCDPDFIIPNGFDENDKKTRDKCLYLKQLLADKNIISRMPGTFLHMERLLDDGKSHEIHAYNFFHFYIGYKRLYFSFKKDVFLRIYYKITFFLDIHVKSKIFFTGNSCSTQNVFFKNFNFEQNLFFLGIHF